MNESRPCFSVVIPVHNKGPHIRRSVSSVLNQSFCDFELLLVDDASTDNSLEEMNRFEDQRIRSFSRSEPGPGGYAARNLGIREARGEWIAFLDADDEWTNDYLEKMYQLSEQFPDAGMLSCGWKIVHKDQSVSTDNYYRLNQGGKAHSYNLKTYISGPRPICTIVAVIRKKVLEKTGGFDTSYKHGGDKEMWLRVLLHGVIGAWYPFTGGIYYRDSVNMVTSGYSQEFSPSAITIQKFLEENPDHPLRAQLLRYANKKNYRPVLRKIINRNITGQEIRKTPIGNLRYRIRLNALSFLPAFLRSRLAAKIHSKLD